MDNKILDIPVDVIDTGKKYFSASLIHQANTLLKKSQVSISFKRGTPENYFVISGIVRENRNHETKLIFKKRLEDSPQGPISSNCDCSVWTQENHCQHAASLFLNFHLQLKYENGELGSEDAPPLPLVSNYATTPYEYGTIIASPSHLEGAAPNATYSSLQYLLHTKKLTTFPTPKKFEGTLLICLETRDMEFDKGPKFKLQRADGKIVSQISLFENLYLFNWLEGETFHLPRELKELIRKIRVAENLFDINEILQLTHLACEQQLCKIVIDDTPWEEIPQIPTNLQIVIKPSKSKKQISFSLFFQDDNNNIIEAPEFITTFTFSHGLLPSFKKKQDAYEFITGLCLALENQNSNYTKHLISNSQKNRWISLIGHLHENKYSYAYNSQTNRIYLYDNEFLKFLLISLQNSFGSLLFRFSQYDSHSGEVSFQISSTTLFEGITQFHKDISPLGVTIYYDRNKIARWSSRVSFERRESATKWFDLQLNISDEDLEVISQADIDAGFSLTSSKLVLLTQEQKDLLRFMRKYTQFEKQEQLIEEDFEEGEKKKVNKFVLPFNRTRIFELFELRRLGLEGALTEEELSLCEKLMNMDEMPQYKLPEFLEDILRPYQKVGFNWLRFLYENRLGACLADDMGLGKTLQTLAFLQSIDTKIKSVLIVCPVTILLNWQNEISKFSNLSVQIYHGGGRNFPTDAKLILTSYGIMKKEVDTTFADKHFDVFIMDEVQQLKNIRSMGAFAARKIKSDFKICLTGTPVENDLAEFYNIIDLCVPGVWGDLQFIRTTSTKKSRLLARKTAKPYILRRTKKQVLKDLPPKIENHVFLTMSKHETNQYKANLINIRNRIRVSPSKNKYGEILKGLLELRQRCLWQRHNNYQSHLGLGPTESTKIEFLIETLEQILEEGHQAIVFSQFTTYLDIIQSAVIQKKMPFSRIDGSQNIKTRQKHVDTFQAGDTKVFLISLKAGGQGLNLTAASYVFIMDPWWNPAVEAQAIDRAHRIGQKNPLTVYRPIIKDSIEEKVLELQKIKRELFYDLLPENDENYFSGKLTMKDFEQLFD